MRSIAYKLALTIGTAIALNIIVALVIDSHMDRSSHKVLKKHKRQLAVSKAEIALIGNSMLKEGVDERLLTRLLGKRCVKFAKGGSASAAWYLTLKNVVVQAKRKPKTAVFFFRDVTLTRPTFRTTGIYRKLIDNRSVGEEPLLQELVYARDPVDRFLKSTVPTYASRNRLIDGLNNTIKQRFVGGVTNLGLVGVNMAIGRVFHDSNMLPKLATKQQDAAEKVKKGFRPFAEVVNESFLPHIIELAKKAKIQVIFVRVKRRRDLRANRQAAHLKQYISDLNGYLAGQGIPFIDFTLDSRLKIQHFGNGDHLNRETGQKFFTKILSEKLKPLIK